MGSLRGIKSKLKEEERAEVARKDRQYEQDCLEWKDDPERYYSDHYATCPSCFGSFDPYDCPHPYWCYFECRFMDECLHAYLGYDPKLDDVSSDDIGRKEWLEDMQRCSDEHLPECFGDDCAAAGDPQPQCHDCWIQGACVDESNRRWQRDVEEVLRGREEWLDDMEREETSEE